MEQKVLEELFGWLTEPVRGFKEFNILRHEWDGNLVAKRFVIQI
jgi:hypothetical protein